jgi:hypothetical protein
VDKNGVPKEFTISSGQVPRKGSPAGEGFNPPSEKNWPKEDNSGLADREAEFEFPLGKNSKK